MKIKGSELIQGVKKAKGVVDESSVIEHLRGFKFHPKENGILDIAGSDGRLTLLAQVPYKQTDGSDGSTLTLSSDKLQQLTKYIDKESYIEFQYDEDNDDVTIQVDKYSLQTSKKKFENEFINFDVLEETEFDDVLDVKSLTFILESLLPLAKTDSPDGIHQTIYLDGENAYLFDGAIAAKLSFKTNKPYIIEHKYAKQIILLLKSTDQETVKLKHLDEEGSEILLRTDSDILTFRVTDTEVYDVDFIDEFEENFSFKVNRLGIVNSILRTKLATEEDEIFLRFNPESSTITLKGMNDDGETAVDEIPISDIQGDLHEGEIDILAENYVKLSGSMRTKEVIVSFDTDQYFLMIKDTKDRALALMTVNLD